MATNRELKECVDELEAKHDRLIERIQMLEQAQKTNETFAQTVNNLVHIILGSGEAGGMAEEVRNTKKDVGEIKRRLDAYIVKGEKVREERHKEDKENRRWWKRLIIGAAVTTIISTVLPLLINAYLMARLLQITP